ncbi:MAG TPA: hypothetical protein VJK04_00990 [Candidatus Paceibacterota bacterium]
MNKIKLLGFVLVILFGAFIFVYGEIDDSPGGQLMGLLAVIIGIVGIIKRRKKIFKPNV